jgi:4-hydroxy-tetrahydrodipicolinate synthase
LNYLRHAEKLSPDAFIAIPPEKGDSLEDYRAYYGALARATDRPIFIQDTGPHNPTHMPVPFIIGLANAHPNLGYIKEELSPVLDRMRELQAHRPPMKRVFSGDGGRGMLAEMSQGSDGTMPGAAYTDVYVQIWDAWQAGNRRKAREIFMHLLPLINLEELAELGYQHMLHRRGVFKTSVTRIPRTSMSLEIRRSFLATLAGAAVSVRAGARADKPLRGIFVIVATPYTESKAVDYEDLAREVDWQNRCGAHGIVWPQMASEYNRLTVEERLHGFEVIAD